jgi:hypothetical protein
VPHPDLRFFNGLRGRDANSGWHRATKRKQLLAPPLLADADAQNASLGQSHSKYAV